LSPTVDRQITPPSTSRAAKTSQSCRTDLPQRIFAACTEHEFRAPGCEIARRGLADAAAGACDRDHLIFDHDVFLA
jgi:hypothetical protein